MAEFTAITAAVALGSMLWLLAAGCWLLAAGSWRAACRRCRLGGIVREGRVAWLEAVAGLTGLQLGALLAAFGWLLIWPWCL